MKESCLPSGPNAKYNPRLKQFDYLRGSNLEAAENSFRAVNKHKSSTKFVIICEEFFLKFFFFSFMTAGRRMVYFLIIEDEVFLV